MESATKHGISNHGNFDEVIQILKSIQSKLNSHGNNPNINIADRTSATVQIESGRIVVNVGANSGWYLFGFIVLVGLFAVNCWLYYDIAYRTERKVIPRKRRITYSNN